MCFWPDLCQSACERRTCATLVRLSRVQELQRLTLTLHINRVVVEMGSSLLLHITHAIIPLASQRAIAVIRWKQTLRLQVSEYSGMNFNIWSAWALQQIIRKLQLSVCLSNLNLFFLWFFLQNQAEAHYKGHKHARKLKAMEAQKNRQRRAGEASSTGRERERERDRERDRSKTTTSEATLPALMETNLVDGTGTKTHLHTPLMWLTLYFAGLQILW